ncbi:hypothetical protein, partial [Streptomyces sp. 2A115]|uniref:hypothetical protein n=1 Tax=Streptomyces sp. 2A115 TaxID=3457439 RepID=UPI003FCFFA36
SFEREDLGRLLRSIRSPVAMTWASPKTLDPLDNRGSAQTPWSWGTSVVQASDLCSPICRGDHAWLQGRYKIRFSSIRDRVRELGLPGAATFYVWHDGQAGQLRCSTGSVPPDELPFGGSYVLSDDLGRIIEEFLTDSEPGVIAWSDLVEVHNHSERTAAEAGIVPLRVWASGVGAPS